MTRAAAAVCHGHWPGTVCYSETPWTIKKVKEGGWSWAFLQAAAEAAMDTGWGWRTQEEPGWAGLWEGTATTPSSVLTIGSSRYCPGHLQVYAHFIYTYILKLTHHKLLIIKVFLLLYLTFPNFFAGLSWLAPLLLTKISVNPYALQKKVVLASLNQFWSEL